MRRRWRAEQIPHKGFFAVVVLTALFPYVTAFITSADGLCEQTTVWPWVTTSPRHRCLLTFFPPPHLAASAQPNSVFFFVRSWLTCDFLPRFLSPSQIVLPKNVGWKQATASSSSMDWTWGLSSLKNWALLFFCFTLSSRCSSSFFFVFLSWHVELANSLFWATGTFLFFSCRCHLPPL